jgi:hypothetical protein
MSQSPEFLPPYPLNTAVLFLVFNRPDTTKRVFDAIRQAKPPRLYVAADGPRDDKNGEFDRVDKVRNYVRNNIDWPCEVKTLFRECNLGCKHAVSDAITWFFKQERQGIILEDDCLPSQSFFWFCEELLGKYQKDLRVWHISGDNFQGGRRYGRGSYYFSKYNHVWGWASWADRWENYDAELKDFEHTSALRILESTFPRNENASKYWGSVFSHVANGLIDTWDYQWTYTVWKNSGLSILPNLNLITNIGFGSDATHTTDLESQLSCMDHFEMELPLRDPDLVVTDVAADQTTESLMFEKKSILIRVLNKIKSVLSPP